MENQLEMRKPRERTFRFGKRHLILSCAVLLIAAALVLNFLLFGKKDDTVDPNAQTGAPAGEQTGTQSAENTADGYFSATQVNRQRARDEALEVLQSVVENEQSDEAAKSSALLEISKMAKAMEAESNIESLVLSKGFTQCVAVINGENCSVVVNGPELQQSQISQINEIVYEQSGIKPANVKIIVK